MGCGMQYPPVANVRVAVQCMINMPKSQHIILIHPDAPPKPVPGAACNGCGVCCLLEPCPLGVVLSRRRHGACVAVRWYDEQRQYRCGAMVASTEVLGEVLPGLTGGLIRVLAPMLSVLAKRWIAAGEGCDSTVEWAPISPEADVPLSPTMTTKD
jgi:hypothetical protein